MKNSTTLNLKYVYRCYCKEVAGNCHVCSVADCCKGRESLTTDDIREMDDCGRTSK